MLNNYPNRFDKADPLKSWQRILFTGDRKSQAAELHEIQPVVNSTQEKAFSYLYSNYSVIKPVRLSIRSLNLTSNTFLISPGQVYVESKYGAFFIDIEEQFVEVAKTGRNYVGIKFEFEVQEDNPDLRDPLTGGPFCGDLGAHRLRLNYEIVVNQDSYPIALVKNSTSQSIPLIFYYTNEGYSQQLQDDIISPIILDYISLRWKEANGDFIAKGLYVNLFFSHQLNISPGIVYLGGRRVEVCCPQYLSLPHFRKNRFPSNYFYEAAVVIDKYSKVSLIPSRLNSLAFTANQLPLAYVMYDADTNKYQITSSSNRSFNNSDITAIRGSNLSNEKLLIQAALDFNTLNGIASDVNSLFSGLLTESFSSPDGSDITNPLYSAAISPTAGLVKAGFTTQEITLDNASKIDPLGVNVYSLQGAIKYLHSQFSYSTVIQQPKATEWLTVGTGDLAIGSMSITPSRSKVDSLSSAYTTLIDDVKNSYTGALDLINLRNKTNIRLRSTVITVSCQGLRRSEDNLVLTFGNLRITEFELLNGTQLGTQFATIKANLDGSAYFRFNIPDDLELKDYVVSLANSNSSASASYKNGLDPLVLSNTPDPINYPAVGYSVAQSFRLSSDSTLVQVKLKVRNIRTVAEESLKLGEVSIVKLVGDILSEEGIAKGDIFYSQVNTSGNASAWTTIDLDNPCFLSAGDYAFLVKVYDSGTELYTATIGRPDIVSGTTTSLQPLTNGSLILREGQLWSLKPCSDLTFELVRAIPTQKVSSIVFSFTSPSDPIHSIEAATPYYVPPGTGLDFEYRVGAGAWQKFKNIQKISPATQAFDFRISFRNSSVASPLLEADNSNIILHTNLSSSSWISKSFEYDSPYTSASLELEYFKPTGTDIIPFISSNDGQTWEPLEFEGTETLVDGNLPLYKAVFSSLLSQTVPLFDLRGAATQSLRKKLKLRVDFETQDRTNLPYLTNLSCRVS